MSSALILILLILVWGACGLVALRYVLRQRPVLVAVWLVAMALAGACMSPVPFPLNH